MSAPENESAATSSGWYPPDSLVRSSPSRKSRDRAALPAFSTARWTLRPSACALRRELRLCFEKPPAHTAPFRAVLESDQCRGSTPRQSQSRPAKSPRQFPCTNRIRRKVPAWALSRNSWPSRGSSPRDRKSTRLNSSHLVISYAVFCLKKKKTKKLKLTQKKKNKKKKQKK